MLHSHIYILVAQFARDALKNGNVGAYVNAGVPPNVMDNIMIIMFILGAILMILIQYTYHLLLTLIAIEKPSGIRLPADQCPEVVNEETRLLNGVSGDDTLGYTTTSIRSTLRHLRREGGFFSPWRGYAVYFLLGMTSSMWDLVSTVLLTAIMPNLRMEIISILGGLITAVVTCRLALVWTYVMISEPRANLTTEALTNATWSQAKKTIPAILVSAFITQATAVIPLLTTSPGSDLGPRAPPRLIYILGAFFLYLVLSVPITIVLVRMQVGVLPDEVVTIIPCDKTFGQDTSETDGVVTMKMAIKSIDAALLKRAYWFVLKYILILGFLCLQFFSLMELVIIIVQSTGSD